MKMPLRVVVMGNYPVYRLVEKLGMDSSAIKRVTTWNASLADALAALPDIELHFITGTTLINKLHTIDTGAFKITFLPIPKWKNILTFYQFTRLQIHRLLDEIDPDIVHGIGTEHIWSYAAVSSGRPSVVTIHGILSDIIRRMPVPLLSKIGIKRRIFAFLERVVLQKTRHLIVINPYVVDSVDTMTTAKFHFIENPVNDSYFSITTTPGSGRNFLFVGGIETRKGVDYLIDAMATLINNCRDGGDRPRLVIAGPDIDLIFANALKKRVRDLGLESYVTFCGFMLPEELIRLYKDTACLVLPSLQETAPMCISEAMSAGLPVIATDVGGITHMVNNGDTGVVVNARDSSALAAAMKELWESPDLRTSMGEKARNEALSRWKSSKIAAHTAHVYKIAMEQTGTTAEKG